MSKGSGLDPLEVAEMAMRQSLTRFGALMLLEVHLLTKRFPHGAIPDQEDFGCWLAEIVVSEPYKMARSHLQTVMDLLGYSSKR